MRLEELLKELCALSYWHAEHTGDYEMIFLFGNNKEARDLKAKIESILVLPPDICKYLKDVK